MEPILITALAALAGVPLGLWLRLNLATLGYRIGDEHDLPQPGPRWWVVWASVLALGGVVAAAFLSESPLAHLPLLPLAVTGPWLAAVDFDVLRIPNRVLAPTAAATALAAAALAIMAQQWQALILPVIAGTVTGVGFAAAHFATKGGIGFGDVKLAAAGGLAVGPLGIGAVWLGILAGSVAALVWALGTRRAGPVPLGPWLLLGVWTSSLVIAAAA